MARPSRAAYFQPPLGGEDDSPYARRKSCKEKQSLSLRMREDMPPGDATHLPLHKGAFCFVPPLCKGRWHGGAVAEGLYNKLLSLQRNPPNETKVFIGWYFIEVQILRKSRSAPFQNPLRLHQ